MSDRPFYVNSEGGYCHGVCRPQWLSTFRLDTGHRQFYLQSTQTSEIPILQFRTLECQLDVLIIALLSLLVCFNLPICDRLDVWTS